MVEVVRLIVKLCSKFAADILVTKITDSLPDETLNRGPAQRCYTPSTLKYPVEPSVVTSCILALSPVTTNRLLGGRGVDGQPEATKNERKQPKSKFQINIFGNKRDMSKVSLSCMPTPTPPGS